MNPETAFFAAMQRRMPHVEMRLENDGDTAFLTTLFIQCSPMAGMMPEAMLLQQAELANGSYRAAFPDAMRVIASIDGQAVGRFIVDWDQSHAVDVAVMPHVRKIGLGLAMLQSWLEVADDLGRSSSLEVLVTNPAIRIYEKLGFVPSPETDGTEISLTMERAAPGRPAQN